LDKTTLIKRCQLGDLESFEQLYRLYSKNAMGTAYLIAGHKGIAEDIVQEAFFQCYKEIKHLKDPDTFDVWFYKVLMRLGWKMSAKCRDKKILDGDSLEVSCFNCSLDTELSTQETRLVVHQAIERLSAPLKTVIILHYFNDLTIKQISMVLGCFQGTVKSRLHNAKKMLQIELRKAMDEDTLKAMYKGKECNANG
jgi:RNA polymerase sigma factor (sigma-70 family)